MDSISNAAASASAAGVGSDQASASISVMKKAINLQSGSVAKLLDALPQPVLATSGSVGTQIDTYA